MGCLKREGFPILWLLVARGCPRLWIFGLVARLGIVASLPKVESWAGLVYSDRLREEERALKRGGVSGLAYRGDSRGGRDVGAPKKGA